MKRCSRIVSWLLSYVFRESTPAPPRLLHCGRIWCDDGQTYPAVTDDLLARGTSTVACSFHLHKIEFGSRLLTCSLHSHNMEFGSRLLSLALSVLGSSWCFIQAYVRRIVRSSAYTVRGDDVNIPVMLDSVFPCRLSWAFFGFLATWGLAWKAMCFRSLQHGQLGTQALLRTCATSWYTSVSICLTFRASISRVSVIVCQCHNRRPVIPSVWRSI